MAPEVRLEPTTLRLTGGGGRVSHPLSVAAVRWNTDRRLENPLRAATVHHVPPALEYISGDPEPRHVAVADRP